MSLLSVRSAIGHRWRTLRAKARGSAIILTYHRVADLPFDPQLISVTPEHFSQQIRVIADEHPTMSAGELFSRMSQGQRIPDRTVVVTLDDGYADTLHAAKPILAEHGVPATAFLCSDFVDGDAEYWWDELERVLFSAGELPPRISIEGCSQRFEYALDSGRVWTDVEVSRNAAWDVTQAPTNARQALFLALGAFVLPLSREDRRCALESLREQAGVPLAVRPDYRTLTADEARELETGGLVELGAHTRSHQVLSARSEAEQREEILGDKQRLESIFGHEFRSFSYPHGGRDKYDETSVRLAREAGFVGACTTGFGIVVPWMDRYTVPRCHTENIPGDRFRLLLEGWFDAAR